nr:hypothetical protein [Jiangella muralis]
MIVLVVTSRAKAAPGHGVVRPHTTQNRPMPKSRADTRISDACRPDLAGIRRILG